MKTIPYEIVTDQNVQLIDHMGNDLSVVNSARISFLSESQEMTEKDEKLMDFLARNRHHTPFEHQTATFLIECPLYIRSQIMRHRTFSFNEASRRYSSQDIQFYVPADFRAQSKNNKQCSEGSIDKEEAEQYREVMLGSIQKSMEIYSTMIESSVAKEMARSILPQCLMTKFWMTGNLRNWDHFLSLRLDGHAQKEAQEIAQKIDNKLTELFPKSYACLAKHR